MPEVTITIGGRQFDVACQAGEEHFLHSAAAIVDAEAQPLIAQMGRLTEARMLLMASLMLADKMAANDDELRSLRARVAELEAKAKSTPAAIIPAQVGETMAEIAARAEALAAKLERKAG